MCTASECYELLLYSPITYRLFNDIATDHVHEFWSNSDFIFCKIFWLFLIFYYFFLKIMFKNDTSYYILFNWFFQMWKQMVCFCTQLVFRKTSKHKGLNLR